MSVKHFALRLNCVLGISHIQKTQSSVRGFLGELLIVFYVQGKRLTDTILEAPKSDPVQLSHI